MEDEKKGWMSEINRLEGGSKKWANLKFIVNSKLLSNQFPETRERTGQKRS